jgi:hypothetical protein
MALGWGGSLFLLVRTMQSHRDFVDNLLLALFVFFVLPAIAGGAVALVLAAIGRWATRDGAGVGPLWHGRLVKLSLVVGLAVIVTCLASFLMPPRPLHTRLLVYGIDGASWDVIETLRPLEMLPEIEALQREGSSGVLRSLEPMLSPIVWTTIGSGQPLGEHGIHGFHVKHEDCQAARIWDIYESEGMSVGTYKWLVTYPPREIRGFMVPGWLATGPEVHPPDLEYTRAFEQSRRNKQRGKAPGDAPRVSSVTYAVNGMRDGLRLSTVAAALKFSFQSKGSHWTEGERMTRTHILRARIDRDLFLGLLERFDPEVATFTYYPTDAVAHRMWKYYEPEKFGGIREELRDGWDAIPSTYRQADEILGELRRRLPEDVTIVALSDHGMCAAGTDGGVAVFGLRAGEIDRTLKQRGADVDVAQQGMKVTVAVAPDSAVPASEVHSLLERFRFDNRALFELESLDRGIIGVTLAARGDDLDDRAEQPVTLPDGATIPLSAFLRTRDDYSGVHHEDAVILMSGPAIVAGGTIDGADLYDVAPTLLALMDVPPAQDMVGDILLDAFTTPPSLRASPESYDHLVEDVRRRIGVVETDDAGDAALEARLQALGYVDTPGSEPPPLDPAPGDDDSAAR